MLETKINDNFRESMLSETRLPYFTLIPVGKLTLNDTGSSGTHPSHVLKRFCVTSFRCV